ncbi:MAG: terpene cyclase/mutase family protein [Planctomycetota bacterium]|nr:terpene cyclase/mutase family protein [Planctomycetota bacterium]
MRSGWLGSQRNRFDSSASGAPSGDGFDPELLASMGSTVESERLGIAITRTRNWLLDQQHPDGYWVGELEGDTILESEYILLLTWLGRGDSEEVRRCARYIAQQQLSTGGWAIYPGGPLEISASVKAYWAMKIAGHSPAEEAMRRAREAILAAGGAERMNSFTRFYFALLGQISYSKCPAVPPELILIPSWCPFNIYEMSAWSRTILVPLSVMWSFRPVRQLPVEWNVPELFVDSPAELPLTMPPSETLDELKSGGRMNWRAFFNGVDLLLKTLEKLHIRPCRKVALKRATKWVLDRFEGSDGLGAIFPPIVWSVIALRCLGYKEDSPEVQSQLDELKDLVISEGDTDRLQPCKSPVWDTAIATIALRDAGVTPSHPSLRRTVDWLLSKEVRQPGDWTVRNSQTEPAGWYFEFNNEFYPDVDDTCMVLMALARCLPDQPDWDTDFLVDDWSPHDSDKDATAILAARNADSVSAALQVDRMRPMLGAMHRGARWILAMQSKDGGWGAFDRDNVRELFTQVPFADHNAMIDPSSADLTARMLEMFSYINIPVDHPAVRRGIDFVWKDQDAEHCWYGRWGVNYLYGTWQCLVGLTRIGIPLTDARVRKAANWLKSVQRDSGGWGETPRSYDDPSLKGQGPPTASQTAWAILGLISAGEGESETVDRGIQFLLDSQNEDGTWDEEWWTGTGFPKVFYLKYHLYRISFPLMALSRYGRLRTRA